MNKFEALYVINKYAKKNKNIGSERHLCRSKALYNLKHCLVQEWVDEFESIQLHRIDGTEYFYFEKNEFGYHIPKKDVHLSHISVTDVKTLDDFSTSSINKTEYTERQALKYIHKKFNRNPNHMLPSNHLESAKWSYIY